MPFFNETQFVHLAFIMSIYLLAHTSTNKKHKQCIHKVGLFEIVDKNKRKKAIIKKWRWSYVKLAAE